MGNRASTTTVSNVVSQDGFVLTATSTQTTSTTPAQGVPLTTVVALSTGNNTIAIPAAASGVTIQPTQSTANTLILKGVTGDTGVVIQSASEAAPFPAASFSFAPAAMTQFALNSAISIAVTLIWQ